MAIQVIIKVTKTDNKDWVFARSEPAAILHSMEQAKSWLCSDWNMPSNQEAILVKTFADMIEANKFIIKQVDTDFPDYEAVRDLFVEYENKDEQITTKEI
jgi:hypothetical protein